jgi:uncharacterized membrane protein YqaE (UPF0057 family)
MTPARCALILLCPPLSILDRGCGPIVLVTCLTLMGWIPGILGALILARPDPGELPNELYGNGCLLVIGVVVGIIAGVILHFLQAIIRAVQQLPIWAV